MNAKSGEALSTLAAVLASKSVALYLVDAEAPIVGVFRGIVDGFIAVSDARDSPLTLIDRDSVWCITEQPQEVKQ